MKNVLCAVVGSNMQPSLVQRDAALFRLWEVPVPWARLPLTAVKPSPLTGLVGLARDRCHSPIASEGQSQPES